VHLRTKHGTGHRTCQPALAKTGQPTLVDAAIGARAAIEIAAGSPAIVVERSCDPGDPIARDPRSSPLKRMICRALDSP